MEFSGAQCPFPTLSCGMRVGGLRESSKHRRSFMQPSYGHRDQCFLAVIRGFLLRRAQSIFWGHEWESCMWGNGRSNDHDELRAAECQFLFFLLTCRIITRYHTSSPPSKNKQSPGGLLLRSLMVNHLLWNIGLCCSRSNVTGVSGGGGGSGNRFRRIVLCEFRCEVCGEGGSLRCDGSRKVFHNTDVVVCSLTMKVEDSE